MPTLFNSLEEVKQDITSKIDEHLKRSQDISFGIKDIIALLSTYIWQLKVKEEIGDYKLVKYKNNIINVNIYNHIGDFLEFNINLDIELRKIKLRKIKGKNYD